MKRFFLIQLCWLVSVCFVGSTLAGPRDTQRLIELAEMTLDAIQQEDEAPIAFPLNTVPEGCLDETLPLTPIGPTVETVIEGFQDSARMIVWRAPCSPRDSALMITFEPLEGEMFVCSSRIEITQQEVQYDTARLVDEPANGRRFCGDLTAAVSTVVDQPPFTETFDHNGGFNLMYEGSVNHFLWVPPYDPTLYFPPEAFELRALTPSLGGLWFEPEKPGQGFHLQFSMDDGEVVMVVFWFTYINANQRFLFGSQPISAAQRQITIELQETRGAQFGDAFDPADVIIKPWGEISFEFSRCNEARAQYTADDGSSHGVLMLERLTHLAGLGCREQDD